MVSNAESLENFALEKFSTCLCCALPFNSPLQDKRVHNYRNCHNFINIFLQLVTNYHNYNEILYVMNSN